MLNVTYATRVGAVSLVLLFALSSAAMASTGIDATPLIDYVITTAIAVLSAFGAWAVSYFERRSTFLKKTQALDILRKVMADSLKLGEDRLRELAKHSKFSFGNEQVDGIVGNLIEQAPDEIRQLGYSETYLANWTLSQLGIAPAPAEAPEGYVGTQGLT